VCSANTPTPAGRIDNCQIEVFLGYVSRHGQTLLDWGRSTCRKARLLIQHVAGIPCARVTGDSV
jgi:hypothetical protein